MLSNLRTKLDTACTERGLTCEGATPVETSPGVWLFQATKLDDNCRRYGYCRQQPYYAIMIGDKLVIQ